MNQKKNKIGVVYSTDPDFQFQYDQKEEPTTLAPEKQHLKIKLDKKQRNGKQVTLIEGFVGNEADRNDLAKLLKNACGVGGSVKDETIIIQGDKRNVAQAFLNKSGYKTKISG